MDYTKRMKLAQHKVCIWNQSILQGLLLVLAFSATVAGEAQEPVKDGNTPLHELKPDYPVPYGKTTATDVNEVLLRIHHYLDSTTPHIVVDKATGKEIRDITLATSSSIFLKGDFRLISYEWGVTYAGMLLAYKATGDERYLNYDKHRLKLISELVPVYSKLLASNPSAETPVTSVLRPHALDDAGAMCAAMIKYTAVDPSFQLRPIIDNYANYISTKEYRLPGGILARNRPLPNTLWLDDLFMSVPALAQMGKLTGKTSYYDDAVKQVLEFASRMFVREKGLFIHGWVQNMNPHPQFHWARANGWAIMSIVELLDVLPQNHPGRQKVLELLKAHVKGLASLQSGSGFWHQLLDRADSFLETSATAIYTYAIARAINKGWIDKTAYGPMVLLAWNAASSKVNSKGQVEGTCVGTGMAFDPAFYYYRPVNAYAAHGYGPMLLAGAEMIELLKSHPYEINDSAVQFGDKSTKNK